MMVQCEACQHAFDTMQAKCEDWSIPEKSFICPNCDAYLENPFAISLRSLDRKALLIHGAVCVGIAVVARFAGYLHGVSHAFDYAFAIAATGFFWWALKNPPPLPIAKKFAKKVAKADLLDDQSRQTDKE